MCFINQLARNRGAERKTAAESLSGGRALQETANHIERAITIRMISFEPPKIRVIRLSRYIRAIG